MTAEELVEKKKLSLIRPILKEARRLGVTTSIIDISEGIIKFSYGNQSFYSVGDTLPFCRKYKPSLVKNKDATKKLLSAHGLCTPKGVLANSFDGAIKKIKEEELSFPLILKPLDGLRSYGVSWDINSFDQLKNAIIHVKKIRNIKNSLQSKSFLVEEQFSGVEFRVLTLGTEIVACAKRLPAMIIGDGTSTILQLIEMFNKNRDDNFKIIIDKIVKETLKKNNLTVNHIPQIDEEIQLRDDVMLAHGGRAIDHSQRVSNELKNICITASQSVGLEYSGIDILIKDTGSNYIIPHEYSIIEVNMHPGHALNEAPLIENPTVNVSKKLLQYLLTNLK